MAFVNLIRLASDRAQGGGDTGRSMRLPKIAKTSEAVQSLTHGIGFRMAQPFR